MSSANFSIREAAPQDTDTVYEMIDHLPPLIKHTWYTYWNLFNNFGDSSFIAEETETDRPIGFFTSHPITATSELEWFGWQMGIVPEYRGSGLRVELQDRVIEVARQSGAIAFQGTVEPDNPRSLGAFKDLALRLGSELQLVEQIATPNGPDTLYRIPFIEVD